MNIHEHQAKDILRKYGAPVSKGVVIKSLDEIKEKIKLLRGKEFVLKAQIHAGGRGKAGGVKVVTSAAEVKTEAQRILGSTLVTHQTGPAGKEVQRLYIEEGCDIATELYLSMLVDRSSSQITIIASTEGGIKAGSGETDIFIYPGYQFNVVDALLTNFHLPKSTLMMLVSAFAGKKRIFDAYKEAIREGYRFFSYGDAMFLRENICSP